MTDKNKNEKVDKSNLDMKITRRKAVKTIAGGITALAAYHTLPAKWEKPIIESIFIPAHAQTSGVGPQLPFEPGLPIELHLQPLRSLATGMLISWLKEAHQGSMKQLQAVAQLHVHPIHIS